MERDQMKINGGRADAYAKVSVRAPVQWEAYDARSE
jgi:hypothetical protein